MPKKWIILLLAAIVLTAIIGIAVTSLAQDTQPTTESPTSSTREIYGVLALGDRVFEPEIWLAGGQEMLDRTIATWAAETIGSTGLAEYLHFDEGFDSANIVSEWFNNDWFSSAFADFSTWTPLGACTNGSVTLYEFSLVQSGINYQLRYWVELLPPTRILAFQILMPEDQAPLLEQYAQRYKPDLFNCP